MKPISEIINSELVRLTSYNATVNNISMLVDQCESLVDNTNNEMELILLADQIWNVYLMLDEVRQMVFNCDLELDLEDEEDIHELRSAVVQVSKKTLELHTKASRKATNILFERVDRTLERGKMLLEQLKKQ